MKIAVLFRGPLRPSAADTRRYVSNFMQNFERLGILPTTYLATWCPSTVDADVSALIEQDMDNVIALSMPTDDFIGPDVCEAIVPSGHRGRSMFYQHFMSKMAIDLITSREEYDIIVHTRTDLRIEFGNMFPRWFALDRREQYQTMHTRDPFFPEAHVNDQFAIAPPAMMQQAWDYKTLQNLRTKIIQVAAAGGKAEDVLQHLLDEAGITAVPGPVVTYALDAQRHHAGR